MARYDETYAILADRAVKQGIVDLEAFVKRAQSSGMTEDRIREQLLRDLEEGGPIFGKYFRSLEGAAASAVQQAARQAMDIGMLDPDEQAAKELIALAEDDDPLNNADPETLDRLERELGDNEMFTSVAELINTCHVCLPLHGKTLPLAEWRDRGLLPEQRHDGWTSECHCVLVPQRMADTQNELAAPLVRSKVSGTRKTARSVAQVDLDKSIKAVETASQTPEGRRTLRALGMLDPYDLGT